MSCPQALSEMAAAYNERHGHSSLNLSCSESLRSFIVTFAGSLDSETSEDTTAFLRAARLASAQEGGLCVDLSGVTYVSSTGIGSLVTAMMEFERDHIPFRLRSVPVKIKELFEMLGLWTFFKKVDADPESA